MTKTSRLACSGGALLYVVCATQGFHFMLPSSSPGIDLSRKIAWQKKSSLVSLDRRKRVGSDRSTSRNRKGPEPLVTVAEDPVATLEAEGSTDICADRGIGASTNLEKLAEYQMGPGLVSSQESEMMENDLGFESTASEVLAYLKAKKASAAYVQGGVAVVTGGSSGLGKETVKALCKTDLKKVVLCARNVTAAQEVLRDVADEEGEEACSKIRIQEMDLANLISVRKAVNEIIGKEGNVDVICNNAGVNTVTSTSKEFTAQGFELQMGVNHVGHYFFTRFLQPHLSAVGRVVTVSSTAFRAVKANHLKSASDLFGLRKPNASQRPYSAWKAYSDSKLANILFSNELQRHLQDKNAISLSLHPGICKETNLWRHQELAGDVNGLVDSLCDTMVCKSSEQAAATIVYACLVDASHARFQGGDFLVDCRRDEDVGAQIRKDLQRDCWSITQEMIERAGF